MKKRATERTKTKGRAIERTMTPFWMKLDTSWLPFADAATPELPMGRLLRLSLFQLTVGMSAALMIGTLNRVMIVELHVSAALVSFMIALPLLLAPVRALIGFRSDGYRSVFGWRRVPFIWFGTMAQFGGLAVMPFALIILSGHAVGLPIWGKIGGALAFLLVGAGMHTTQTAGLALATDLAPEHARPRVVAMLCAMLLAGMIFGALLFGWLLTPYNQFHMIQVIQTTALITIVLNCIALWKQEPRRRYADDEALPDRRAGMETLSAAWGLFRAQPLAIRRLVTIGLGTLAFSMQDILLEPYGGQVLHLPVGETTALTALLAAGAGTAAMVARARLTRNGDPYRIAAAGVMVGLLAFACVIFAAPLHSGLIFGVGVGMIGFGGGLFLVGTLSDAMNRVVGDMSGLALGAWGAVQVLASGIAIAIAGVLRGTIATLATHGTFGPSFTGPAVGYDAVYHIEIYLLFATLIAIGPLVRRSSPTTTATSGLTQQDAAFGLK